MKNSKININKKSGLFFWIGLNISLLLVITAFEWESKYETRIMDRSAVVDIMVEIIPITEIKPPQPPKPIIVAPIFIETNEPLEIEQPDVRIDLEDEEMKKIIEGNSVPEEKIETYVNDAIDKKAEPINGYQGFYEFVAKNLKYPSKARKMGVEGRVYIQFVIDEFGNITEVEVIKGIGMGCDQEAVRVIKLLPPWSPGILKGKPVRARMVLPLTFKLRK